MSTTRPSRKALIILVAAMFAGFSLTIAVAWLRVVFDGHAPSKAIGTVAHGRIENAHVIPPWGPGYVTYSLLGSSLGRQYVDGRVRDALLATFAARSKAEGGRRFVVGETGWPGGGRFRPHRSHQNGMAVDVFMPVQTKTGERTTLRTWPWNKFGYGLEFDERGELAGARIDFEALAAFLLEVDAQARKRGLRVERVIITPEFVPLMLDTPTGRRIGPLAGRITRKPVWVRHDEHFHIDFENTSAFDTGSGSRRNTRILMLVGMVAGGGGCGGRALDPCTSSEPQVVVMGRDHTLWLCDRGYAGAEEQDSSTDISRGLELELHGVSLVRRAWPCSERALGGRLATSD